MMNYFSTEDNSDEIQQDMAARVAESKTSFAAGMAILPQPRREAMHALYAFCRRVDDIADDGETEEERRTGLARWRIRIDKIFGNGETTNPIGRALIPAIKRYNLEKEDFLAIIDGMAMDAGAPIVAPDRATFDLYCDRVASAVGRASVRIFGDSSPAAMDVAHHLGRALQITNILRDIHEDSLRGRLYLPRENLERYDIPTNLDALTDAELPKACFDLAADAEAHFAAAWNAMEKCDLKAMTPARIMGGYYRAILKALKYQGWECIQHRVRLPTWQKLWIVLRYRFFA